MKEDNSGKREFIGVEIGPAKLAEPVHQMAIDKELGSDLNENDRMLLKKAQVEADENQSEEDQFTHAMSDGLNKQTREEAASKANAYVEGELKLARELERLSSKVKKEKGECADEIARALHDEAMRHLGFAIHTLQDATSPTHEDFHPWHDDSGIGGKLSRYILGFKNDEVAHGWGERLYPRGRDKDLLEATRRGYDVFSGKKPMPDKFFSQ